MSSLKPLADRVLVKPDEAEQKTASGLYIASNAQEKPQRGTIVAVGAGKVNDVEQLSAARLITLKTGQRILAVVSACAVIPLMKTHDAAVD